MLVRGQAQRTFEIAAADRAAAPTRPRRGDDAAVRAREAEIHARLADMVAGLPSVVNLNVWDAHGRPIARSDRFPTDRIVSVDDRAVLPAAEGGAGAAGHQRGDRRPPDRAWSCSTRRSAATTPDGRFGGVVAVSLSPAFFREYYRSLAAENPTLARFALVRTDGAILADWPQRDADRDAARGAQRRRLRARAATAIAKATCWSNSRRDGQRALRQLPARGRCSRCTWSPASAARRCWPAGCATWACWPRCWCRSPRA